VVFVSPPMGSALPPSPRRRGPAVAAPGRASRTLSRTAILDAALAVLDAEGLDAVTMRRVATQLSTGPASLYAHVADKEEMVAALLDRVIGEVELPATIDPANWQEQLKQVSRSARATFVRHRDIARATLGTVPTGENALTVSNLVVGILLGAGASEQVASFSIDLLSLYFSTVAYEESLEALDEQAGADSDQYHLQLRQFFGALPVDRFPHLVALAVPMTTGGGDERFEFGLDLLVRGIASTITAH
jgi:AcrR family transcriptional regulator